MSSWSGGISSQIRISGRSLYNVESYAICVFIVFVLFMLLHSGLIHTRRQDKSRQSCQYTIIHGTVAHCDSVFNGQNRTKQHSCMYYHACTMHNWFGFVILQGGTDYCVRQDPPSPSSLSARKPPDLEV